MRRLLLPLIAILIAALLLPPARPAAAQPAPGLFSYFSSTGHNVGPPVLARFNALGGEALFGPPLTELIVGSDGLQVQYFERARFEVNPAAPAEQRVSLSRLGAIVSAGRSEEAFAWRTEAAPGRRFFPESGHSLGGAFEWFWQSNGALATFGYPISEELSELASDGQQRLVQYFERARFEYHPELQGQPGEVQLAPLGRVLLERDPLALAARAPAPRLTMLGQASTGFAASSYERVTNISRAAAMAEGVVVPAGAEFSFISLGDFSAENGFAEGYAIVGGRLERVIGGGLCQVSTTLFRAVSNAGLQVTRRVGHSHIVNFYENILGFDATVFVPGVDFRWRNDSPGPVYITSIVDRSAGRVTFQIWGVSDGRQVSYDGPYTKSWVQPGAQVWQLDRSMPAGAVRQLVYGRPGVEVTYYRNISFADGSRRRDTYFTRYKPWEDFFVHGPGVTPPAGATILPPK